MIQYRYIYNILMSCLYRMEETVRSLLQNQGVLEQTAVDTVDIMKAYKVTLPPMLQDSSQNASVSVALSVVTEISCKL